MCLAFPALNLQPVHFKVLPIGTVVFGKITETQYPNPLGFNKDAPSRFSDPRNIGSENKFGVIYFAENYETCFAETLIRDELINTPKIVLPLADAGKRIYVPIKLIKDIILLDLTHGNFLPLFIDSDTIRGRIWTDAQNLALRIFLEPAKFDGILYESRFTSDKNIALFDRGLAKVTAAEPIPLTEHSDYRSTADKYLFELSL